LISQGIPLIGNADEIPWALPEFSADPNNAKDIIRQLHTAYDMPQYNVRLQQESLTNYTNTTAEIWAKYFS
jgi:hypothetical protein